MYILAGSGWILIPLASSQRNLYDIYIVLCIQCWTPDDGQNTCPKHVEFCSKKEKIEKLVHFVGFIIRIDQCMLTHVFVICYKSYCIMLRAPSKRVMCYRRDRLHAMQHSLLSCVSTQPSSIAIQGWGGGVFDGDEGQQKQQTYASYAVQLVLLMNCSEISAVAILSKHKHINKCLSIYRLISHQHLVSRPELPEDVYLQSLIRFRLILKCFFFINGDISKQHCVSGLEVYKNTCLFFST